MLGPVDIVATHRTLKPRYRTLFCQAVDKVRWQWFLQHKTTFLKSLDKAFTID